MNIYTATRTDKVKEDEFLYFVLIAYDPAQVKQLIKDNADTEFFPESAYATLQIEQVGVAMISETPRILSANWFN